MHVHVRTNSDLRQVAGEEWEQVLGGQLLPAMGFDQATIQQYIAGMRGPGEKDFRNFFVEQMQRVKSSNR